MIKNKCYLYSIDGNYGPMRIIYEFLGFENNNSLSLIRLFKGHDRKFSDADYWALFQIVKKCILQHNFTEYGRYIFYPEVWNWVNHLLGPYHKYIFAGTSNHYRQHHHSHIFLIKTENEKIVSEIEFIMNTCHSPRNLIVIRGAQKKNNQVRSNSTQKTFVPLVDENSLYKYFFKYFRVGYKRLRTGKSLCGFARK